MKALGEITMSDEGHMTLDISADVFKALHIDVLDGCLARLVLDRVEVQRLGDFLALTERLWSDRHG